MPPRDVELVMQHAGMSRDKAIKVLTESGGDIVGAIMVGLSNSQQAGLLLDRIGRQKYTCSVFFLGTGTL